MTGNMQNGSSPLVEYRVKGVTTWSVVAPNHLQINTSSYEAAITSLVPGTEYECQVTAGGVSSGIKSFTTAPKQQLENSSFDDWHIVGSGNQALYNPWKPSGGNHGHELCDSGAFGEIPG